MFIFILFYYLINLFHTLIHIHLKIDHRHENKEVSVKSLIYLFIFPHTYSPEYQQHENKVVAVKSMLKTKRGGGGG